MKFTEKQKIEYIKTINDTDKFLKKYKIKKGDNNFKKLEDMVKGVKKPPPFPDDK